jgi:uncharacterized protein (TIGR03086 family)
MSIAELYKRASDEFGARVHTVAAEQWALPTPCAGWDTRDLVNHVVAEDLWAVPLLGGATVEEVGDRFDGDVLGDAPAEAWDRAVGGALGAIPSDLARTVHVSFGEIPASEYLSQLVADHLVHAWDLARAIGGDEHLPDDLVHHCIGWFRDVEDSYRSAGVIGPAPPVAADADAQTRLLAMFGRQM